MELNLKNLKLIRRAVTSFYADTEIQYHRLLKSKALGIVSPDFLVKEIDLIELSEDLSNLKKNLDIIIDAKKMKLEE